jgi:hypothetical protein
VFEDATAVHLFWAADLSCWICVICSGFPALERIHMQPFFPCAFRKRPWQFTPQYYQMVHNGSQVKSQWADMDQTMTRSFSRADGWPYIVR